MTRLVPTRLWVYDLYHVRFLTQEGGSELAQDFMAAASENHLKAELDERAGLIGSCGWFEWEPVKENVEHPRVVGSFHGISLHEDCWSHGRRLADAAGLR